MPVDAKVNALLPAFTLPTVKSPVFLKFITPPEVAVNLPLIAPANAVPEDPMDPPVAVKVKSPAVINELLSVIDPLLVAANFTAFEPAFTAPTVYEPAFVKFVTPPAVAISFPVIAPDNSVPEEPIEPPVAVKVKSPAVISELLSVIDPLLVAANFTAFEPAFTAPTV